VAPERHAPFVLLRGLPGVVPLRGLSGIVVVALASAACGAERGTTSGTPDVPVAPTDAGRGGDARRALAALRYDERPAPEDPSNRISGDAAARRLGQRLFFDGALSGPLIEGDNDGSGGTLGHSGDAGRVSCASCHVPETAFVDTRSPHQQISLAAQWTKRRTPTLLDAARLSLYDWDGRRDSIWGQALGVMENDREFNSARLFVAEQVFELYRTDYEKIFGPMPPLDDSKRFPALSPEQAGCREVLSRTGPTYPCRGKPGDGADYDGMAPDDQRAVTRVMVDTAKAMAAYVALLRCGPSRFDAWLDGDDAALSEKEQRGATLFAGRGKCTTCHSGPNLTDGSFHNVGLSPATVAVAFVDAGDKGAADGIAAALADPLNTAGDFSDGNRKVLPAQVAPELTGAFRTPTLRCLATQPSFMHTGQLRSLEEAVAFHDRGGDRPGGYPGTNELVALGLSEDEKADLVAFLQSLEGPGPARELRGPP
jgi:cytochrome c peroxidase